MILYIYYMYACMNIYVCSLIKMLYWMIYKTNQPLTIRQLEHAVKRNFGGLDNNEIDAVDIFKKKIHITDVPADIQDPIVSNS